MAHKCSRDLAEALVNPVGYQGPDLCLPVSVLCLPSWKFKTTVTTSFTVPAGGWGHVVFYPQNCFTTAGALTEQILTTTSGWSGSSVIPGSIQGGVVNNLVRSPCSALRPQVATRLVTWGAEVSNTTILLNRGGSVMTYSHPDHASLVSTNAGGLIGNMGATWTTVNGDKQIFRLCGGGPVQEDELSFLNSHTSLAYACISATASVSQTYTVVATFHWEVIATAGSERSPSHSDPGPASTVLSHVQNLLQDNPEHINHAAPSFYSKLKATAKAALAGFDYKDVAKFVKPAVAAAMSAYTGSPGPLVAYVGGAMSQNPSKKKAIQGKPQPAKR